MKILKVANNHPKKKVLAIKDLTYIKTMTALSEIMKGAHMVEPIQVNQHHINETPRKGANGADYIEKKYSVWKGSQRIQAALSLGYTHIEGIILNARS